LTEKDHFVHVSGHPARDEMIRMYQHVHPQIAIPVHGELRHMAEHGRLATQCQVGKTIVGENGSVMRIAPGNPGVIDHVISGRLSLEGNRLVPLRGELNRQRKQALWNGVAIMSLVVDESGILVGEPQLTTLGVVEKDDDPLLEKAVDAAKRALHAVSTTGQSSTKIEAIRVAVRRVFRDAINKKPITQIHLHRSE